MRPLALAAILAVHALVFVTIRSRPAALSPLDGVEVTLAPLGDAAEDQKKQDEIKPAAPPPVEKVAPPPAQEAPPPKVVAPETIPLPAAPPEPPKAVAARQEKLPEVKQIKANRIAEKRKQEEAAERRRKAQEARQELRRGAEHGAARASAMSPAAYAGLLAAEIRRHTFYPSAARASGATGVVGVAFTIGPSGRLASLSITRSSGNPMLDAAARTTLRAIHTPPPPGGRFSTSTNIRFHFN
ncbi:energy transducer TonB [Rhodoblastus sp.]|uniref:energy transducer TonB n=1 Tax=Rhodoblastus sp. TaxID=1962975 RepID=UPI00261BDF8E|nr:energy transducer TonB [Rhodoblastus sp.]